MRPSMPYNTNEVVLYLPFPIKICGAHEYIKVSEKVFKNQVLKIFLTIEFLPTSPPLIFQ